MDKNAIKKYAVWARRELIDRVTKRSAVYGITTKSTGDYNADSVNGHLLSGTEKRQRQALIRRIKEKGYEQVMEEVAYAWFNRFAALRFMEVNGYLPSHIRVFTDDEGRFRPQILSEAIHLELDGLNMEKVYQLKDANQEEELFKYLLIVQCNALNSILPGIFQKIEDFTELLLPDYLLREGSVIEQMVTLIPEEDWKDQVQIIGWLYQYYNTEPKDKVFADLKRNVKISKESIPAATQLFTPDWIVHYMVENSLGRLWLEGHPNDELKAGWKYYLDEAEQKPEVQVQLVEIRKQYAVLKPEEILTIDPCAGSGHILCVLFDTLVQIYEDYGYTAREAAVSIVQNNLWGLDIDDRAAQLACFAVMMKARQYDRRFFTKEVQPHVYAIQESNGINRDHLNYLGRGLSSIERNNALNQMNALLDEFIDAKEYGSILQPREYDWALLARFVEYTTPSQQISLSEAGLEDTQAQLRLMIAQGKALVQKYHAVVTNPPYMGNNGFDNLMASFAKSHYNEVKNDLFAIMMVRCIQLSKGFLAMITQQSWMFLSSYEWLRHLVYQYSICSLVHLGSRAFDEISGEMVATTCFSLRMQKINGYIGNYKRLVDYAGEMAKESAFMKDPSFFSSQTDYSALPGSPTAYWTTKSIANAFKYGESITKYVDTFQGIITGDNDRFLRMWFEPSLLRVALHASRMEDINLTTQYWIPYNKGGEFRKWYGVQDYVVYWKNGPDDKTRGKKGFSSYYLREYVSWSYTIGSTIATRYYPIGFLWDVRGSGIMDKSGLLLYLEGLITSKVGITLFQVNNSTLSCQVENIIQLPIIVDKTHQGIIEELVNNNNLLSKAEWDSFEVSWDFQRHPLVTSAIAQHYMRLADCWRDWERACNERFAFLKANEEELNRIFIGIYGLQDELTPDVDDKDVTVRKADLGRDIRSLISYAVGCMLGRYSLEKPGLAFAGGNWQEWLAQEDTTDYAPDKDGILPITDDEYFYDDIVTVFVNWVKTVYGTATLEENLKFIADALDGKGSPREVIRNYFLNDFYKDHLKVYQKRPIYWLFDSGKKNGFKALIYMHRYQPDTIARVRTDYVHEMQSRYRTAIADVEQRINGASTSERVKLTKRLTALQAQAEELRLYEEKVHHLADQMIAIDLDDGVKVNYAKFADVLAPIK